MQPPRPSLMISTRLTPSNILIFVGFLLSQTCLLPTLSSLSSLHNHSYIFDVIFYICTIMLVGFVMVYLYGARFGIVIHFYQFAIMPLFSSAITHLQQQQDTNSILRLILFTIGFLSSILMLFNAYSRQPHKQNESIVRISVKYRLLRLIKMLLIVFLVSINAFSDLSLILTLNFVINLINLYCFLISFTFQNPFHQYLTMISSLGSLISSIDFILYVYHFNTYSYIGELFILIATITQPTVLQKAIQWKYLFYATKWTKHHNHQHFQLIGVFTIMKQVVLRNQMTFKYTQTFEDQIQIIFQKMSNQLKTNTIQQINNQINNQNNNTNENSNNNQNNNTNQQQMVNPTLNDQQMMLKLIQKHLKDSKQFLMYQFYLNSIIKKQSHLQNKALTIYYQKKNQRSINNNIFTKVQMKLLYQNIFRHIQLTKQQSKLQKILQFSSHLTQLKNRLSQLCRFQIGLVNLLQNSTQKNQQVFQHQLKNRYQKKMQIQNIIDRLNSQQWHIYSENFLFICLVFKILFQRETQIIQEKLMKFFVVPIAKEKRRQNIKFNQNKDICIVVFSSKQKGLILNQNQKFSKTYGKILKSSQKSKRFINDLFPSGKQRLYHQQQMQVSQKCSTAPPSHSSFPCLILRKLLLTEQKTLYQDPSMIILQNVIIHTRLYYQLTSQQSFICQIQVEKGQSGDLIVMKDSIQELANREISVEIVKEYIYQQLGQHMQLCQVYLKDAKDQFQSDDEIYYQQSVNASQLMNYASDDKIQDDKIQKIQKEYDREKSMIVKPQRILLLLILLLITSFIIANFVLTYEKQYELTSAIAFLNVQIIYFQDIMMTEQRMGILLIIYKMVNDANITSDICLPYGVANMHDYVNNYLLDYARQKFQKIQSKYVTDVENSDQINNLLNEREYLHFDIKDPERKVNYGKYMSLTKSVIYDYLYSIKNLTQDEKDWFKQSMKLAINTGSSQTIGFYSNLRNLFTSHFSQLNQLFRNYLILFSFIAMIIGVIVMILFFRIMKYRSDHVELLKQFTKSFVQKRAQQMDFILDQIVRIQKNQIQQIQIHKSMNIKLTQNGQVITLDFQQFQRESVLRIRKNVQTSKGSNSMIQAQYDDQKQMLYSQTDQQTSWTQNSSIKLIYANKYKLLMIIILVLSICATHFSQDDLIQSKVAINIKFEQILFEMQRLIESITSLLIGQWLKFKDLNIYSNLAENNQRINNALYQITNNNFKQKIHQLFEKSTIYDVLYTSYCASAVNLTQCQGLKAGFLKNGLAAMIPFFVTDYNNANFTQPLNSSEQQLYVNEICEKLIIYVNFTSQNYGKNILAGYTVPLSQVDSTQFQFIIGEIFLSLALFAFIGIVGFIQVSDGQKIRNQVMSMDTKRNLYELQENYRPYLNQLYYRKQYD